MLTGVRETLWRFSTHIAKLPCLCLMRLSMLQLVDSYTLRQSRSVLVRCLHSECLLLFGLVYVKALIEIEVGECQIKVSTLELFSIQKRARKHEAILDGEIDLDSHTNVSYFPNLANIRHAHRCTRNPVAFFYSL